MAFWFYRGLRRGVVTTRYPKTIDPWTRELPSPPAFHTRRLSIELVDELAEACPAHALKRDRAELIVDLGRCTGCGSCAEIGGDAVRPSGTFLLASTDRSALIKRVPIRAEQEEGER